MFYNFANLYNNFIALLIKIKIQITFDIFITSFKPLNFIYLLNVMYIIDILNNRQLFCNS